MAKTKTPTDEKFENQDFDLFKALAAIDRKDYEYYDRLTEEQKKKFVPFMMIKWLSSVQGSKDLQEYYIRSVNHIGNKHFLNFMIGTKEHSHPKLQWLLLCASTPGLNKIRHHWIPQLKEKVTSLKEQAQTSDVKTYFEKIYNGADKETINEISNLFCEQQKKKYYLAQKYPNMKHEDIETLNELVTKKEIDEYEEQYGNN
jgi:hypothetical protein